MSIIQDNYGNRKRISDKPDNTNIVLLINKRTIKNPINPDTVIKQNNNSEEIELRDDNNKYDNQDNKLHYCSKSISYCQEKEDGSMWFNIGVYKGRINFCPYCGYKAKGQITK